MFCLWHKWQHSMVEDHLKRARYIGRRCRCGRKEILYAIGTPPSTIEDDDCLETVTAMTWKSVEQVRVGTPEEG